MLVAVDSSRSDAQSARLQPNRFTEAPLTITAADCKTAKLGDTIAASAVGEPVSAVAMGPPKWVPASDALPPRCEVDGRIESIDKAKAPPVNFRVWLPAEWNRRAAQQGGGGMNGVIPDLRGPAYPIDGRSPAQWGFVTYGSDSGHQSAFGRRGGESNSGRDGSSAVSPQGPGVRAVRPIAEQTSDEWALNDEAIRNLGYMQLKKTHDAAMVLIQRAYGERPRFNYFTGTSQGGREALTVAQRYPADYDGVIANVPIVSFSSLMLAPELIRIQETPLANWVAPAKVNAIRGEFLRQCDHLDALVDGVINNYMACRAIFDVTSPPRSRRPWTAKRCRDNVDPNPSDSAATACLTDGQISTLELVYSHYRFATPLAHGVKTFGMSGTEHRSFWQRAHSR